jgi:hypothetical protein
MSVDSFGMAMASLPAPTAPSAAASLDSVPAKKQATSDNSSTTSASSNTDPLMAALQQTLSQLGYSMPAGSLTTSATGGASATDGSDGSNTGAVSGSNSDATSTGAQFLAALYQALSLQQSISANNGAASSGGNSANAIASFNDSATSGGGVSAYRDLGSRIADLSNAANAVDNDADDDAGEWDVEVDDVEVSEPDEAEEGEDSMDTAMSNLSNALQAHVSALDSDPAATVTLSDVLDGLSDSASSLNWQPVGVLVDVSA